MCQACKDRYDAGRLRSGFDPAIQDCPIVSLSSPSAAELVLDDLRWYLEGANHQEILDALLRFAKARGVTLPSAHEKCSTLHVDLETVDFSSTHQPYGPPEEP
jgi:hypothetical protein